MFSAASLTINLDPVTLEAAFTQPANLFHEKYLNTTSWKAQSTQESI